MSRVCGNELCEVMVEELDERIAELIAKVDNLRKRLADSCYEERSNRLDYGTPCEEVVRLEEENKVLREALANLLVWAEWVKNRYRPMDMGMPNSAAIDTAQQALKEVE